MREKKIPYLNLSNIISIVSILITIFINYKISIQYLKSDGKTQALFGLIELFRFEYQYYMAILGIISFVFVIIAIKEGNKNSQITVAIFLSLLSIIIVFIRIWRIFI